VGICGTDIEVIEGKLGYYKTGVAKYPIVPGHESSGTVVALGPKVTEFSEGDRVVVESIQGCGECQYCKRDDSIRCRERREVGVIGQDGACATYMTTRARYAHKVPAEIPLAKAALAEPLAVVHKGLRRLGSGPSDKPLRCLVTGAGTIGHLAALVLASRGHSVTVFDSDAQRLSLLSGTVSTSQSLDDLEQYDWIVEATGKQKVLSELLEKSGAGATLLLLGFPYAEQHFSFESLVAYDRSVVGSVGSSRRDFVDALHTLQRIEAGPFLQAIYPLSDFEKALAMARTRTKLKVMLTAEGIA
jgi:2-desacetyl-2-hydroxyethyl bacteriochlorophyllide A dehydrogenase